LKRKNEKENENEKERKKERKRKRKKETSFPMSLNIDMCDSAANEHVVIVSFLVSCNFNRIELNPGH